MRRSGADGLKLWAVHNGVIFMDVPMEVLVIAPTEERAIELARERFRREAEYWRDERFCKILKAELLADRVDAEWASEVRA
ncbi:MAG TPA: hypothetical protein VIK82_00100 [Porticoccaceae bacterium]